MCRAILRDVPEAKKGTPFGRNLPVQAIIEKPPPRSLPTGILEPLPHFSINLLAFYHECSSLIGCSAHYLFGDR